LGWGDADNECSTDVEDLYGDLMQMEEKEEEVALTQQERYQEIFET
jgi:hypothetical protein